MFIINFETISVISSNFLSALFYFFRDFHYADGSMFGGIPQISEFLFIFLYSSFCSLDWVIPICLSSFYISSNLLLHVLVIFFLFIVLFNSWLYICSYVKQKPYIIFLILSLWWGISLILSFNSLDTISLGLWTYYNSWLKVSVF